MAKRVKDRPFSNRTGPTTMISLVVMGLGYIGLPTAAVFAQSGCTVVGVDINPATVATINAGRAHIYEPGLDRLVKEVVASGALKATTIVEPADAFIIAVPTPFAGDHKPDLTYVRSAVEALAPALVKGNVVILESTSPIGATEQVAQWLGDARPDLAMPANGQPGDVGDCVLPRASAPRQNP